MSDHFFVRAARHEDLEEAAGLLLTVVTEHQNADSEVFGYFLHSPSEQASRAHLQQTLDSGDVIFVVESPAGGIAGLAQTKWMQVKTGPMHKLQSILRIGWLAVHPDYRGRGLGTKLLQACEELAHERGADQMRLDVLPYNDRAKALYQRFGFRVISHEMGMRPRPA